MHIYVSTKLKLQHPPKDPLRIWTFEDLKIFMFAPPPPPGTDEGQMRVSWKWWLRGWVVLKLLIDWHAREWNYNL